MNDDLRKRAEQALAASRADIAGMPVDDAQELIHELQVHQIELQMQNDELREAHEKIEAARDQYADLYEFAPVGYVTIERNRAVRQANLTIASLLGVDRGTLLGKRLDAWIAEEHRDDSYRHFREVFTTGRKQSFETEMLRPNGERFWARIDCIPARADSQWAGGCRATVTDITRRKAAEEALRKSRGTFQRLAESDLFGVGMGDARGNITYVNDEMLRMMGRTRSDFETGELNWLEALAPESRADAQRNLIGVLLKHGRVTGYEGTFARPDGGSTPFLAAGALIKAETGSHVTVAIDLSDMKAAQRELQVLNRELEQRVRRRTRQLRALAAQLTNVEDQERQRLAQILHDDLQQQLAVVKMLVCMLGQQGGEDGNSPDVRRIIEVIDEAIARTRALSRELSPANLRLYGLFRALETLADEMQARHGLHVRLDLQSGAEPCAEEVASVLYHAVSELLFNVVKHSGGASAEISARRQNNRLYVSVRDRGRGLDPAEIDGDPTAHSSFGLLNIKERVTYLGGDLIVDAAPGQGCSVTVVLPDRPTPTLPAEPWTAGTSREREPSSASPPAAADGDGTIRILLVDDHDLVRESLAVMLSDDSDFSIVGQAASGPEAITLVNELRPDVVLMDVSMPGMSGIEATAAIHSANPDIAVLGLTMHSDPATAAEMRKAGAGAFLPKSASFDELRDAILVLAGAK
jgi:PAS domain S-box-containing protein